MRLLKLDYAGALYNLAVAQRKSGDKKSALATYEKLRTVNQPMADELYSHIK